MTLTAWVGRTLYARDADEPAAATRIWGDRDYLFKVEDLVLAGAKVTPREGDLVVETIAGVACTFELATPTGEPVWRWSDPTRTLLRVHCKRFTQS